LETVLRSIVVSTLRNVTEASAIADPLASRTIPVTEPAESWALAELGDTKSVNTNARKENP